MAKEGQGEDPLPLATLTSLNSQFSRVIFYQGSLVFSTYALQY